MVLKTKQISAKISEKFGCCASIKERIISYKTFAAESLKAFVEEETDPL